MRLFMIFTTLFALLASVGVAQIDRSKKPAPSKTPAFALPKIERTTIANGLKIILVEKHDLPIIQMQLVFNSGSTSDPQGKEGTAVATAQMLTEGTAKRTSLQIANDIGFIGASLAGRADYDGSRVSMRTLSDKLDAALDIFGDAVLHPTFPQNDWERVRKSTMTAIMQRLDQPPALASDLFARSLYGEEHPYGRQPQGTENSLPDITVDGLKAFYESRYRPNDATLIVVGDITMKKLKPKIEKIFGGWKQAPVEKASFEVAPYTQPTHIVMIDKPSAAQSQVWIGTVGVPRSTPDFFPLTVMNTLLGGQFNSRINWNLREVHGYTYGARSFFAFRKESGPFVVTTGVKTTVTDSSVVQIMKELTRITEEEVPDSEMESNKSALIQRLPGLFETTGQVADNISNLVFYNLPDTYYNTYIKNIEDVGAVDVFRVAKKYIDPSKLLIVIVGDVAATKEGLEKLGYGPVNVMNAGGEKAN